MAIALDLSKSAKENFYNLLTKSTTGLPENAVFTDADLIASGFEAVSGRDDGNNTKVEISCVPTSTLVYGPDKTLYYKRKDIAEFGIAVAITDDLANWSSENIAATVLAYLQANFSAAITADEFTLTPPLSPSDTEVTSTLTIVSDHYTLFGELVFTVTQTRVSTDAIDTTETGFVDGGS